MMLQTHINSGPLDISWHMIMIQSLFSNLELPIYEVKGFHVYKYHLDSGQNKVFTSDASSAPNEFASTVIYLGT